MDPPFMVDMDKVPPLNVRSTSSAPPTARSAGSSGAATPRTGGGLTARSSDGKGTPRDHERLPLGQLGVRARASGSTAEGRVPRLTLGSPFPQTPTGGSPGTTARSWAASSSSPGGYTSRSLADFHQELASSSWNQSLGTLPSTPAPAQQSKEMVNDMCKELEAMKRFIQKDINDLQRLWAEKSEVLAGLCTLGGCSEVDRNWWTDASQRSQSSSSEKSRGASLEHLGVQESIQSGRLNWHLRVPDASLPASVTSRSFELPQFPGVSFSASFGAAEEPAQRSATDKQLCCFRIAVDGAPQAASLWRATLSVERCTQRKQHGSINEGDEEDESDAEEAWSVKANGDESRELMGQLRGCRLQGCESAAVVCPWLEYRPNQKDQEVQVSVICRAHLELRGVSRQKICRTAA
eukprot:TRINITY_DN29918_c0_g1_i1.p1 TRINITY_DN29918_c0_g1~~TRINITY_DN29918_c0_g1_i1.p1  ORF type:complete len:420 (-),score=71.22 TRINITY_DN29918_c0_g1_i1:19-1242(-)